MYNTFLPFLLQFNGDIFIFSYNVSCYNIIFSMYEFNGHEHEQWLICAKTQESCIIF